MSCQQPQLAIADIIEQLAALEDLIADPDLDLVLCERILSRCQAICAAISPSLAVVREAARADHRLSARAVAATSQLGWALDSLAAQLASVADNAPQAIRELLATALDLARRLQVLTPDEPPHDNIIDATPHLRARAASRWTSRSLERLPVSSGLHAIRETIARTELSAGCHLTPEGREQLSRALYRALYSPHSLETAEAG